MADHSTRVDNSPNDSTDPVQSLEQRAIEARIAGDFDLAGALFARAAVAADSLDAKLHLELRHAYCLLANDRIDNAVAIAESVAQRARSEEVPHELADALGIIVEHHMHHDRLAEAAEVLAEAMYVLERLPDDPAMYQVVHNMGATYADCGFVEAALELYERSLRLAENDADRQFSYSSMAAAYNAAALREPDETIRNRHLHDGLYAATAALDPRGDAELLATAVARAHRSMMLAAIGHYDAALDDAREAQRITAEHGMREEQVVAMASEAVASWRALQDPSVLELIAHTDELASEINAELYLQPMRDVEVEVLWSLARFDDARQALERNLWMTTRRLHQESSARFMHVRLGVEHLRVEALSESDPLTGLPNRRYLGHRLPEVLELNPPVCVGVIDLDGFKQVNDTFSYAHGDHVLQEVASMLERVCRRGDSVVRLGGDEFVMVLRETSPGDARAVFERIRQMIATRSWEELGQQVRLTASVGVAVGGGALDAARVLSTAAEALRHAKRSGRDCIAFR